MAGEGEPAPEIELHQLTRAATKSRFCCGEQSVNKYFRSEAWKKHEIRQHRITVACLANNETPCGYFSVATVAEEIGKLPGTYHLFGAGKHFPCLQLVWIGVDKRMQRKKIGTALVGQVIQLFADVGSSIGLPHLILVPIDQDVKAFYAGLGFIEYDGGKRMFLPLQTAIEATS